LGLALLLGAPVVSHFLARRGRDVVALTRILQVIGLVLLISALLIRPYDPATRAVPAPPEGPTRTGP
jgi:hypothetical protein